MQTSPLIFVPRHQLSLRKDTITTPAGLLKTITYKSITPNEGERIKSVTDVPHLFEDLQHVNIILTNACNLDCSYCYEQHEADYGRFTPTTLKQIYDFLLNSNDIDGKVFQFFGGEPDRKSVV